MVGCAATFLSRAHIFPTSDGMLIRTSLSVCVESSPKHFSTLHEGWVRSTALATADRLHGDPIVSGDRDAREAEFLFENWSFQPR